MPTIFKDVNIVRNDLSPQMKDFCCDNWYIEFIPKTTYRKYVWCKDSPADFTSTMVRKTMIKGFQSLSNYPVQKIEVFPKVWVGSLRLEKGGRM